MNRRLYDTTTPEINLTPLVDVVFVILIMFIVVAPLLEVESIHLASAPDTETLSPLQQSSLTITVDQQNQISLNGRSVSFLELKQALQKEPKSQTPQLFQDKHSFFEMYQNIKNILEESGFEKMDLILEP